MDEELNRKKIELAALKQELSTLRRYVRQERQLVEIMADKPFLDDIRASRLARIVRLTKRQQEVLDKIDELKRGSLH